jgi:hypothetical protein
MRYRDTDEDSEGKGLRPSVLLAMAVAASAGVIGGHAFMLPPDLVMPALSAILIVATLGVAMIALLARSQRGGTGITCWDLSGALYFFACWAGVLSEPEGVLALMEELRLAK